MCFAAFAQIVTNTEDNSRYEKRRKPKEEEGERLP
jgi:hypothetical protein